MSSNVSFMTWLSNLYIRNFTARRGVRVGEDQFGNVYYRNPTALPGRPERRWVIYAGDAETTSIPAEWHGWMHYSAAEPVAADSPLRKDWQKPHQANPTGSVRAYRPSGHTLGSSQRAPATGDYEAWTPRS